MLRLPSESDHAGSCVSRPVYPHDFVVFCTLKFSAFIVNISRHVLQFICFPVQNMHSWVFSGICVSLATSHCHSVSFCFALCVIPSLKWRAVESWACISAAKYEHLPFLGKPCWNYLQVNFTENKMKWKRTDGESAKAVREQVFLSRYKSEPGIVESSVSKSSAYWQYCCFCLWSVAKV